MSATLTVNGVTRLFVVFGSYSLLLGVISRLSA